jgi:hypothetical protein
MTSTYAVNFWVDGHVHTRAAERLGTKCRADFYDFDHFHTRAAERLGTKCRADFYDFDHFHTRAAERLGTKCRADFLGSVTNFSQGSAIQFTKTEDQTHSTEGVESINTTF